MEEVIVTTARNLTKIEIVKVEKLIHQRFSPTAALKLVVDPAVIGGIKLRFGSEEIDATVLTKLATVNQQLLKV